MFYKGSRLLTIHKFVSEREREREREREIKGERERLLLNISWPSQSEGVAGRDHYQSVLIQVFAVSPFIQHVYAKLLTTPTRGLSEQKPLAVQDKHH